MTAEAQIAREVALQFECKLDALRRNQDGTVKLTLTIHPDDFPMQLMTDPLGQIYVAVMVAKNDDGTPKVSSPPAKYQEKVEPASSTAKSWKDLPYVQRAGMLAQDKDFQAHIGVADERAAAEYIRRTCGVESRKDIEKSTDSMLAFEAMYNSFDIWRKYERVA